MSGTDKSISRLHATFEVDGSSLYLTDNSTFGTRVNNEAVLKGTRRQVPDGAVVVFGSKDTTVRVEEANFVFCPSKMDPAHVALLDECAQALGGTVVRNWTQACTHVVTSCCQVTPKVVLALAAIKPVVGPAWLHDALAAVRAFSAPPAPNADKCAPQDGLIAQIYPPPRSFQRRDCR